VRLEDSVTVHRKSELRDVDGFELTARLLLKGLKSSSGNGSPETFDPDGQQQLAGYVRGLSNFLPKLVSTLLLHPAKYDVWFEAGLDGSGYL
jgi:hypothetical protein